MLFKIGYYAGDFEQKSLFVKLHYLGEKSISCTLKVLHLSAAYYTKQTKYSTKIHVERYYIRQEDYILKKLEDCFHFANRVQKNTGHGVLQIILLRILQNFLQ